MNGAGKDRLVPINSAVMLKIGKQKSGLEGRFTFGAVRARVWLIDSGPDHHR
jgi:hypothetical protein